MKRLLPFLFLSFIAFSAPAVDAKKNQPASSPTRGDLLIADYFRSETALLAEQSLADLRTLEAWTTRRAEYRRQLQEMLGLWPLPERTDLQPVITGKLDADEFTVEKLHFQASPRLYVTANLYVPKKLEKPAPAILYVCGHSRAFTNGVSFGNKTGYRHHGAWLARNGYVCLMIDTLQLGEIEGVHHGTARLGQWWWNARGYTPAGVEAWFGLRALDYLCARPEVDKERIGMTGRSGGGSYSWTVAALDDRVKVVCPVAGITDLQNQVVDGCVAGHCDCMFFVNTYRWDFPQVAALIAPRPLLIANSDKDGIFPLDGVVRLHAKTRRVYELYGAADKLGLLITEGPHADTQDLQVPVLRWFNRFLRGEQPLIESAAKPFFTPPQLKVFEQLPADAGNTNVQSSFVARGKTLAAEDVQRQRESLLATLKEKCFGGWPAGEIPLDPQPVFSTEKEGVKFGAWDFASQLGLQLRLYLLERSGANPAESVSLNLLDEAGWRPWLGAMRAGFEAQLQSELADGEIPPPDAAAFAEWKRPLNASPGALAFFAPRGVGMTAFSSNAATRHHLRRRFMLLGQTLDGMRVWDIRRAVQLIHFVREGDSARVALRASGAMAVNARFAALFEPGIRKLELTALPEAETDQPDYLNATRFFDAYAVAAMLLR